MCALLNKIVIEDTPLMLTHASMHVCTPTKCPSPPHLALVVVRVVLAPELPLHLSQARLVGHVLGLQLTRLRGWAGGSRWEGFRTLMHGCMATLRCMVCM